MDDVYRKLGVRTAINAAGTLTRLGGTLMDPEVLQAMVLASRSFVRIDELSAAAGQRIAELTGAEAALVTSGAAAGLTLAAAACICRDDLARMDQLPHAPGNAPEIIIPRSHRNGYDHALRAAGARLVEVGLAERTRDPQPWEIEAAITAATVAVAFAVGFSPLELTEVVAVARRHDLPVIVDAAAALPPRENLRAFIAQGADLVVFSGGKAIRGPQSTGILCGRKELVASAALQQWDMDVLRELWNPPAWLIDPEIVKRGVPNHGIGRSMKVGKEEIVGLLVALERFVAQDEQAEIARLNATAQHIAEGLDGLAGVDVELIQEPGRWKQIRLTIDSIRAQCSAIDLLRGLEAGDPPIHAGQGRAREGIIEIDPFCLGPGDGRILVDRVRKLLAK